MSPVTANRATLLAQLAEVFRQRGYEGATLTQLSAATGLGKASLYHHFPGGKAEMMESLLRDTVADLERGAFGRLNGPEPPDERLQRFLAGFADYLDQTDGQCLLAVLALGSVHETHGQEIAAQFRDWQQALARVFEERGEKPKRAARRAGEVLDRIYGAQVVSRLTGDAKHRRRAFKRLARELP